MKAGDVKKQLGDLKGKAMAKLKTVKLPSFEQENLELEEGEGWDAEEQKVIDSFDKEIEAAKDLGKKIGE